MLDHLQHTRLPRDKITAVLFRDGEFGKALRKMNIHVEVIEWSLSRRTRLKDVPAFLKLIILMLQKGAGLVICNTYGDLLMAGPAALFLGVPLIWRSHADVFPYLHLKTMMRNKVLLWFLKHKVGRILSTTNYDRDLIIQSGVPSEKVCTVYNGIDPDQYFQAKSYRETIRKEFNISDQITLVGFVARMVPQKGHGRFFEALSEVTKKVSNVKALIVGDTTLNYDEPEYRDVLKRQVEGLGLEEKLCFTGFREDIPAIMNAIDIFVSASLKEPFGRTTVEAMICGKPVVATRTAGSQEIVLDGVTGILVPIEDTKAMATAILSLVENSEKASSMGRCGRKRAKELYNLSEIVPNMDRHCLELYDAGDSR